MTGYIMLLGMTLMILGLMCPYDYPLIFPKMFFWGLGTGLFAYGAAT